MAGLEQYHAKRDFRKTAEPAGKVGKQKRGGGIFVVQKHAATRLHYDFRLEHDGVLWSWAVTRGPSLDPHEKRLAVHVEDHPIDYASFEGTIPKGQYGGGSVIVWDEGKWLPDGDPATGMKKGHIDFELEGHKLNGRWHLVRLRPRPGEKRDNWLLIKSDDAAARPGEDVLAKQPKSVKSGLTIDEVGQGKAAKGEKPKVWQSNKPAASKAKAGHAKRLDFIEPQLATLEKNAPAGDDWLHEVKFDGYRMQAQIAGSEVRLLTRAGLDWTEKFDGPITAALGKLKCRDAIIDGEIVVLADSGVSSFPLLQADLSARRAARFIYYVFDLMRLDGEDLRREPLVERKQALAELLGDQPENSALRFSDHFHEPGKVMLQHVCRMGLEGVVSKRADAPYRSGRGLSWIKSKCTLRQEFVIGGYLPSDKTGRGVRSLLVGYYEGGKLHYAGRVGTGFSGKVMTDLKKKLDGLKADKSPFSAAVPKGKGLTFVKPELVGEVEFRSWTSDRIIRHASFQGLREDKPAEEVVQEQPKKTKAEAKPGGKPAKASAGTAATSVKLSHPDKLLWHDEKVSKQDLLDHYALVWPRMEQFVVNRPLSLVRAPDGIHGQRFFQKHASPGMSDKIARMKDPTDGEEILFIKDFDGLAALVQYGVVEVHIWGCTLDALEKPDQIIFDLDPDEGVDVGRVREAALDIRKKLDELSLPNLVKTSGGKGYHVLVPLKPSADWDQVKDFAHDFARALEQAAPDRYTATLSKKARTGKIFVDYLRNGRGSTTVAPYSSRAKKGATISMPVTWTELEKGLAPNAFPLGDETTLAQLKKADPWKEFFKLGKALKRE
ncbi:DNA ligase D [Mesorhizobium sp. M2D.F.Ca.ET.185.01.1.1]|uniref:DNA ligase D n=1 Tax=unclassified Mesorhizobium TaxID=325217 RepID=UPI000FCC552F|nr:MULTISPECIES: DNA ligase D [unclassified Mesorhizobium]TGP73352.1 DNA ligase D [bacterium M00.F.Ca.ET.227.01.1.1]TGP84345.1 DNA ligase D [bacterium M00.F.Ca.ET.221.01.1.1]TGP86979.1 DNA ligase D [bacterium M00.F.Ca.ET.222.01.1.1]TGU01795.1 DNA ligase D [bacterium M00.F.Ca.ET.163.01.1.1]TGU19130.1 DNA ligase D [bacterium M00.F.Ca.ET.156.01.1.1]TGU43130.1 DNA ligase D [bacterium M00.F.Ca.ET.146.01.1.1]TGV65798.1 DNA ligase D [Mesorhizobium sp. M2D.F.Ca.ET.160.01.1.1]TGW08736.1 DNA ligase D